MGFSFCPSFARRRRSVEPELRDIGGRDDVVSGLDALGADGPAAVAASDEADVEFLVGPAGVNGGRAERDGGGGDRR